MRQDQCIGLGRYRTNDRKEREQYDGQMKWTTHGNGYLSRSTDRPCRGLPVDGEATMQGTSNVLPSTDSGGTGDSL